MKARLIACIVLVAATAVLAGPDASANAAPGSRVLRSGTYTLRYFGKDLGRETFTILQTDEGYEIRARVQPKLEQQVASEATYVLDAERRFVRATWRRLEGPRCEAEYRIEGDEVVVEAWENGRRHEQRVPHEPGTVITGPHYVTDFFVLEPLALDVRAAETRPAWSFGFESWRLERSDLHSQREKDQREKSPGGKVKATVYRCRIKTPEKTWKTRSWLDDDGVSVRITIDAPIGWLDIRLAE